MEPKPQGIHPLDLGLLNLPWLAQASKDYQRITGRSYTETSFLRGNKSIEILERVLPDIPHRPNILLVGLGLDAEPLICCYEPFRVAAHLEGRGLDYEMTLVDVDRDVIEDIKGRTKVFLAGRQYSGNLRKNLKKAWEKYLNDTKQTGRETFEREDGLIFSPYLEKGDWYSYKNYLRPGISVADVSPQFRAKLVDGEISLILDDIAVADLKKSGKFDYAECTNVLYLIPEPGQQLALANISTALRPNARLLVNDIGGYIGTPIFTRLGGWLDDEKLAQLGFVVEEMIDVENRSQTALLRKYC